VWSGELVLSHHFKVGNFVALMSTIHKFDSIIGEFFSQIVEITIGYGDIRNVAKMLNANTELKARLAVPKRLIQEAQLLASKEGLQDASEEQLAQFLERVQGIQDSKFVVTMKDATFVHEVDQILEAGQAVSSIQQLGPLNLCIEKGQILAITDGLMTDKSAATGKKTLLMLMGGQLLPTHGNVWMPQNTRVRILPAEPLLFKGTLLENLTIGNLTCWSDAEAIKVYQMIGGKQTENHDTHDVGQGGTKLSRSDRIYLALSRALLSGVHLLLIASTLDSLGDAAASHIMTVLHKWVQERGLPGDFGDDVSLREARSVFFSTSKYGLASQASAWIEMPAMHKEVTEQESEDPDATLKRSVTSALRKSIELEVAL